MVKLCRKYQLLSWELGKNITEEGIFKLSNRLKGEQKVRINSKRRKLCKRDIKYYNTLANEVFIMIRTYCKLGQRQKIKPDSIKADGV